MATFFEGQLEGYALYLRSHNFSEATIRRYRDHLRRFLQSLGQDAGACDITSMAIVRHRMELARTCAGGTVGGSLTAIRSFCKFLVVIGMLVVDPTTSVKWPQRKDPRVWALTPEELRQLMAILEVREGLSGEDLFIHMRNRRVIFLMLYAGLRLSEAADILAQHISLADKALLVYGKRGKLRTIPLHPALEAEIRNASWLRPTWPVAGTQDNKRLRPKSMAHIFERWLPARGMRLNAHKLRRTFATQMLRNGAKLRDIQLLLGHDDLKTTARYLGVDPEDLRDSIQKLPAQW